MTLLNHEQNDELLNIIESATRLAIKQKGVVFAPEMISIRIEKFFLKRKILRLKKKLSFSESAMKDLEIALKMLS